MSSTMPRQRVDEVPEAPGERREEQQHEDDRERRQPEDRASSRRRPRPSGSVPLHQAHDGLEHEREEQRQEERHHRFADVDERPREADDRRDEQHRPDGEVDAQRRASPSGRGSEPGMSSLRHARTLLPVPDGRPQGRGTRIAA